MRERRRDHVLALLLRLRELVLELVAPVAEEDHAARIVVVLNVDDVQADNLRVFGEFFRLLLLDRLVWVDDLVETGRLTED